MATTQPIKHKKELQALRDYYLMQKPNLRNYALIVTGINTALRIGDTLQLTWSDVYDDGTGKFRPHIVVREDKTGKENIIAINQNVIEALTKYRDSLADPRPSHYIFCGWHPEAPLSRYQAFRIIKQACAVLHLPQNIACHSLRKTFGYHAWLAGANPIILMQIYNRSSFRVTKRYLGIEQDDKDQVFLQMNL